MYSKNWYSFKYGPVPVTFPPQMMTSKGFGRNTSHYVRKEIFLDSDILYPPFETGTPLRKATRRTATI